jgi:hypothetical protein
MANSNISHKTPKEYGERHSKKAEERWANPGWDSLTLVQQK